MNRIVSIEGSIRVKLAYVCSKCGREKAGVYVRVDIDSVTNIEDTLKRLQPDSIHMPYGWARTIETARPAFICEECNHG